MLKGIYKQKKEKSNFFGFFFHKKKFTCKKNG